MNMIMTLLLFKIFEYVSFSFFYNHFGSQKLFQSRKNGCLFRHRILSNIRNKNCF